MASFRSMMDRPFEHARDITVGATLFALFAALSGCGRTELWSNVGALPVEAADGQSGIAANPGGDGDDGADGDDGGDGGDGGGAGDAGPGGLDLSLPFNGNVASAGGFDGTVYALAVDPQTHAVYVGGGFYQFGAQPVGYIARLLPDGTLDPNFATGASFDSEVYALAVDGNGGVFAAGAFTSYFGVGRAYVARIRSDGELDTTFVPSFNDYVLTLAYDAARDRLYAGGYFTDYGGTIVNRIVRLMPDGSRDATFVVGNGFDSAVEDIYLAADAVYVSGSFDSPPNVARLGLDGAVDPTFVPALAGVNPVLSVAMTTDRIILGGVFFRAGAAGYAVCHARLDLTGQLAPGYDPTTADDFESTVFALLVAGADAVWAAGGFQSFGTAPAGSIARLRLDGSLDPTFQPGAGFDDSAFALAADGDALYVGGRFTSYDGTPAPGLARITPSGALTP
jgi:hypothetical protein